MPYLETESSRLYYQLHNPRDLSTRPLVLLHGLGSSGDDWLLQQAHFSEHFPTLVVDLRGHGRSSMGSVWPSIADYAADVATLLDVVDRGPAHVLGLSLGGAVALQFALDFPGSVASLTIVNAFARFRVGWRGLGRTLGRLFLLAIGRMDWLGAWIAAGIFPDPDQEAWRKAAAERLAANSRQHYVRAVQAVARFDLQARLGEVHTPTLIVAGERDTTVGVEAKQILADRIPEARMALFPQSGHGTPYDASDRFNDVVLDFLLEVERTRAGSLNYPAQRR